MAITTRPHTTARHTGTTGPSGSTAAFSSEPDLGSTALATSTATSITASIQITATLAHIPTVETSPLITYTETRCVMDAATQGVEAAARNSASGTAIAGYRCWETRVSIRRLVILMRRCTSSIGRTFAVLAVVFGAFGLKAGASATLLIEEPYGKLGFFTATGHSAVYLSGVCAQTPLILRQCAPGESGIVLSRYDGVSGYDWIAIPLVPYLYAVERPEEVPLFADARMVAFLRDRYRRKYLEDIAPDLPNGETPGGNWYELVGSSYDRTIYGFEIATTPEQDQALILKYNSSPNRSHFHAVSRNCADFVKDVINFYQPRAVHRSYVADIGITTPKQMAKTLVKFSTRHPELRLSRFIIPQVPGDMARSKAVHGVVESFLKSKKYIVPSGVASPIFAGCVAVVFVGSGSGR